MRLSQILRAYKIRGTKARAPQNPNKVPFQPILPLKLKDRVSGKVDSQKQVACLHEMSILFAALKNTEFTESACMKEIEALKKSNVDAMNAAREEKLKNAGQITTTGRVVNSKQLNRYLRKFPQPE